MVLAETVTGTGIDCAPYPPDSITPPAAWVDAVTIDLAAGAGFSFCESGLATATITAVKERNDRAGSTKTLEDLIPPILAAITGIGGVRVLAVQSGGVDVAGVSLPAVVFTVEFAIQTQ
jgi:hypothetical protein